MRAFVLGGMLLAFSAATDSEVLTLATELARQWGPQSKDGPQPDATCIAKNCLGHVGQCMLNANCRNGMLCTAGCGGVNQTCIFQCTSDYEDDQYDNMIKCFFTEHDCMKMPDGETFDTFGSCRDKTLATPLDTWLGQELTADAARGALSRGDGFWLLAQGLSHAYDCFDCQNLWWYPTDNSSVLRYEAVYKIHKSNGDFRWNFATYFSQPYGEAGRFLFHADDYGGLVHDEDWRILGIDERNGANPEWIALYYCGGAPGVKENYEGSCLVTPDGKMPPADEMAKIDAIYEKAGIKMECIPNNSAEACAGHPTPPPPESVV